MVTTTTSFRGPPSSYAVSVTENKETGERIQTETQGRFGGFSSTSRTALGSSRGSVVFVDPQVGQSKALQVTRGQLEKQFSGVESRVSAVNQIQQALNTGSPIPREAIAALGIKSTDLVGSKWERIRGQVQSEQQNYSQKAEKFNVQAGQLRQELQPQQLSPVYGALGVSARQQRLIQSASLPEAQEPSFKSRVPRGQRIEQAFVTETGRAFYGEPGTETGFFQFGEGRVPTLPYLTRKGGIAERAGSAFFGLTGAGAEIGGRYAGAPGAFFGGLIGGGFGLLGGAFEAGPGTALKSLQKGVIEPVAGPFVGDVYGLAGTFFAGPRAAVTGISKGVGVAAKGAPAVLRGVRALEKGKSIYATTPLTNLLTYGGATVARAAPTARKIAQSKAFQFGALGPVSVLGPQVGAGIVRESYGGFGRTQQFEGTVSELTTERQNIVVKRGYKIPELQLGGVQLGGTTGGLGAGLGLGVLGEEYAAFGGESFKEVQKTAEKVAARQGYKGAEIQKAARAATQEYFTRQAGGLVGFTAIEATTELGGRYLIGKSIAGSLGGKAIGLGSRQALKKTFTTTAKTIPYFAGLGAYEGFLGQVTSDLTARKARTIKDIPARIQADPLSYLTAPLAGAISAPLLGAPVIAGGTYRIFKKGSKVGTAAEKSFMGAGYFLDPLEQPGDYLASLFGVAEPRFKVRTITGTQTQDVGKGVKIKSAVPVDILEYMSGVPTTQRVQTIQRGRPSIYSGAGVPTFTSIFNVGTPQPVNNIFSDFIGSETPTQTDIIDDTIQEQTQQQVPTIQSIFSVPVGVPVSKAGVPPFFPFFPGGGGGAGGRGRGRRTFFNEFAFAAQLLGQSLVKKAKASSSKRKSFLGIKKIKMKTKKRR